MLTERRKADRERMATELMALVREAGYSAERHDVGTRSIWIAISTAHGLCLNVDFDGSSVQPDVHVLSWHGVESPYRLAPGFAPSVNQYHWHKATDVAHGFLALCTVLRTRLQAVRDGSAFQAVDATRAA